MRIGNRTMLPAVMLAALALGACAPDPEVVREEVEPTTDTVTAAANPELLVSAEWLEARLDDPEVVVVHVAPSRTGYDAGHIPGARFLPFSAVAEERDGLPNMLPAAERLVEAFEAIGVSDGARVVLYGNPLHAARAFVALDYLGHGDRAALLDGGLAAWEAGGRELSTQAPEARPGTLTPRIREAMVVDAEWVDVHRGEPGYTLVDARPAAQYRGEVADDPVARPGHIPGAVSAYWEEALSTDEPRLLRDPEALRAWLAEAGVEPGDTVVSYCRTGVQASHLYFVARYLGYEARIYDGSFTDWSARSELPVTQRR